MARTTDVKVRATWDDDASRDADRTFENIKRETKATERQAKQATSAFQGLGTAIAAFASVEVLRRVALFVNEVDRLASKADAVAGAFRKMATDSGANPASLFQQIQTASKGTLSNMQAMIVANTALSSGIEPLYKNLGTIIQNVRSVSTALGRDATVDIERVISAINKQEQELLDELGIVARADTAYKEFAASVGKSANALSDLEKRTAFANTVIEQLRQKAEQVGSPIDEAADSTARLAAAWENFQVTMGQSVALENSVAQLTQLIQLADRIAGSTGFSKGEIEGVDRYARNIGLGGKSNPFVGPVTPGGYGGTYGPKVEDDGVGPFGPTRNFAITGDPLNQGYTAMRRRQATDNAALMGRLGGGPSLGSFGGFGGSAGTLPRGIQGQQDQAAQILAAEQERIDAAALERKKSIIMADEMTGRAEQHVFAERMKNARATAQLGDLVGRLNPKMGGLMQSLATMQAQFATGDVFGMAVTGITAVVDAFSSGGDALADTAERIARAEARMKTGDSAGRDYVETVYGDTDAFKAQTKRIRDVFNRALGLSQDGVGPAVGAQAFFNDLGTFDFQSVNLRKAIGDSSEYGNADDFFSEFSFRFGDDTELIDVAAQLLSDGLSDAGEAAGKLAAELDPLNRAIAIEFDGREMALRRSAQGAFAAAGADPAEQAKVFASLKDSIANLSRTESARIRRANDTALISGGGGGSPAPKSPGGGTSGVSDPYSLVIDTGNMPPPTIDLSGDGLQIWKHEIDEWTDILYGEVIDGRKQLEIDLGGDRLKIWKKNIDEWTDILYGEVFDGRKALSINLNADGAVNINRKMLDDWSDLFTGPFISGEPPKPLRYDFNQDGFVDVKRYKLDNFGDVFAGNMVGQASAATIPISNAFSLTLEGSAPTTIDFQYLADWGFFNVSPAKVKISDIIDLDASGFLDLIQDAVNRLGRDRRIGTSGGGGGLTVPNPFGAGYAG